MRAVSLPWSLPRCLCGGKAKNVKSGSVYSSGGSRPADSYPLCLRSQGDPEQGDQNILLTCKFSLLELNACSQRSVQICAARGVGDWGPRLWVSGSELHPRPGGRGISRVLNQKQSGLCHLHMCTWEGPHRALPPVLPLMGLGGLTQTELFQVKISSKRLARFIPLQLQPLRSALPEQWFLSFRPFPHGWGN